MLYAVRIALLYVVGHKHACYGARIAVAVLLLFRKKENNIRLV